MDKKMTLLEKAYNCTDKVLKFARFPSVMRKIRRELERALDKAEDKVADFNTNLLLLVKTEVEQYKSTDSVNVDAMMELVQEKEEAELNVKRIKLLQEKILVEKSQDEDAVIVQD